MKNSFHARFTRPTFVSHFMPIPVKHETKGHFRSFLPMTDRGKRMKRGFAKIQALISRETALVSCRFRFHFTVPLVAANPRRQQGTSFGRSVFALLFWPFRAREFLK